MKSKLSLLMVAVSLVILVFAFNSGVVSAHGDQGLVGTTNARDNGAGTPDTGGGGATHEDGNSGGANQNGRDQSNSHSPVCSRHLNEQH